MKSSRNENVRRMWSEIGWSWSEKTVSRVDIKEFGLKWERLERMKYSV